MNLRPRILVLVLVACTVSACGRNQGPPLDLTLTRPRLDAPDSASLKLCASPVGVPDGPLTQKQVETLWGVDVDHLIECDARQRILVEYIKDRDAGLTAGGKP